MKPVKPILKNLIAICLGMFTIVTIYPLVWMVLQSLKTDLEFYKNQFSIPENIRWINYAIAWSKANFSVYYKNSIIVTLSSMLICIFSCSLSAYALARIRFAGNSLIKYLLVAVTFLPGVLLLFPVYTIANNMGILGTRFGLIGPYVAGQIPVANLIMISAFTELPNELAESAKIDGCNHYGIWWRIMMPLTKNSLTAIAILQFIYFWNEYMWALISVSDKKLFTLTIGLADMASKVYSIGFGPVFAGMVMTTLPIIVIYVSLQKQFVKAVTSGAVKG